MPFFSRITGRRRKNRRAAAFQHEPLESRIALSVNAYTQVTNGALDRGWVTLTVDGGDDLYVQQAATPVPSLLYADNASFLNQKAIDGIDAQTAGVNNYFDVFVVNASPVETTLQASDGYPFIPGDGYKLPTDVLVNLPPTADTDPGSFQSVFVLQNAWVDPTDPISGTLSNGVGGRWDFTATPRLVVAGRVVETGLTIDTFTPIGTTSGPNPVYGEIRLRAGAPATYDFNDRSEVTDAILVITWDTDSLVLPGGLDPALPPELESIDYTTDRDGSPPTPWREEFLVASSSKTPSFSLPMPRDPVTGAILATGPVAGGTLSGTIEIPQFGIGPDFNGPETKRILEFTTISQNGSRQLVFRGIPWPAGVGGAVGNPVTDWQTEFYFEEYYPDYDTSFDSVRRLTGEVVGSRIDLFFGARVNAGGSVDWEQEVGPVKVNATYAIVNATLATPTTAQTASDFTLFPGQDFSRTLTVDLVNPYSITAIESPVVQAEFVTLRSTGVIVNSQVSATGTFTIGGSALGAAVAEQVSFNAANAAQAFDIRVGDDPATDAATRGTLFVSATGSLGGAINTTPGANPTNANSVFVLANTSDVFVEGIVSAKNQSYIMQSPKEGTDEYGVDHRGPYYLSTRSTLSGSDTGRLVGGTVAVTLGNDVPTLYDDTANGGSSAFNVVTLETDIDSMRIQAADRALNPILTPFPYILDVREKDAIKFDAVAASSLPITLFAAGDINFNATLASAGDVSVTSDANLLLSAPLSTNFGKIVLAADELNVANSVRVLDSYSDDQITDIRLESRSGDMLLSGAISAINAIEIVQSSTAADGGKIYGPSRVIGERLKVEATGSVTMKTDVRSLSGRITGTAGGFSVDELDDLTVELFGVPGLVSLTANGVDPLAEVPVDTDGDGVADSTEVKRVPALRASLDNGLFLVASTPNGSAEVIDSTAQNLVMGDRARLLAGTAAPMVAAGSVKIRSTGGSIDVLDGPLGGGGAYAVRVASTVNLIGVYDRRTPGTFPGTLTAADAGSLPLVDGVRLRVRDTVLLKDQDDPVQNGVYSVVSVGGPTQRWVLARTSDCDTTAEMAEYRRFRPGEGSQVDRVFVLSAYGDEDGSGELLSQYLSTPVRVTSVTNRYGAYVVRAASTQVLDAVYVPDPTADAGRGTAQLIGNGSAALPLFDGVQLKVGDKVLVRLGNLVDGAVVNGVYEVGNVGGVDPWELNRVPKGEFETGYVVVNEGTLRAKITGSCFQVAYDSLGNVGMRFEDDTANCFTEYGSDDYSDKVTFVVSTNGGTNRAAGSLGKMISLAQANSALDPLDETGTKPQTQAFQFGSALGTGANATTIRLTQQLPLIQKALTIDASAARYPMGTSSNAQIFVNGTGITRSRSNVVLPVGAVVHGFEVESKLDELGANTHSADGTVISGLRVSGFANGAAVSLKNVDDVLVSGMTIGVDSSNRRLPNRYGVLVNGGAGGFNTVFNSVIQSSTVAGVGALASDSAVRIVKSTIGGSTVENTVGVQFNGGSNSLGVNPVPAPLRRTSAILRATPLDPSLPVDDRSFLLPRTFNARSLYVGMGVAGSRIVADEGWPSATVKSITKLANGLTLVEIENGTVDIVTPVNGKPATTTTVDFGIIASVDAASSTIDIPAGMVNDADLFLGQAISGSSALASGTFITGIERNVDADDNLISITLTLSRPTINEGLALLQIGDTDGGRNFVMQNITGVTLSGGTNRVVNTTVSNAVYDGISISGGTQTVGGGNGLVSEDGRTNAKDLTPASNAIYSNGQYGIRVRNTANPASVRIQGNYLGVALNGTTSLFNKLGNIGDFTTAANVPVVGDYTLAAGTYTRLGGRLTVTLAGHGQVTGQKLWLAFTPDSGAAPATKEYAITVVDSNTFTIMVPNAGSVSGTVTVRNMLRIVMPEIHGLLTGHRLWLEFTNTLGTRPTNQALAISRVNPTSFIVVVPSSLLPSFNTGTAAVRRYGGTKAQLVATNQRDYEGNLHGVSSVSGSGGNGSGGVIPALPTPGRPVLTRPRT